MLIVPAFRLLRPLVVVVGLGAVSACPQPATASSRTTASSVRLRSVAFKPVGTSLGSTERCPTALSNRKGLRSRRDGAERVSLDGRGSAVGHEWTLHQGEQDAAD